MRNRPLTSLALQFTLAVLGICLCAGELRAQSYADALATYTQSLSEVAAVDPKAVAEKLMTSPALGASSEAASLFRTLAKADAGPQRGEAQRALDFIIRIQTPMKTYLQMLGGREPKALSVGQRIVQEAVAFEQADRRGDFADNARVMAALATLAPLAIGQSEGSQERFRMALELLAPTFFGLKGDLKAGFCQALIGARCQEMRSEAFWVALGPAVAERIERRLYETLLDYPGSELGPILRKLAQADDGAQALVKRNDRLLQRAGERLKSGRHSKALTAAAVRKVEAAHRESSRRCYDSVLRFRPGAGSVELEVSLRGDGSVARARPVAGKLRRSVVAACLVHQVEGWLFPPNPEEELTLVLPFSFSPPADSGRQRRR